jgi:glycosyltransferase involved in cell wall biosynthesis
MKILTVVHGYPPAQSAGTEVYARALSVALSRNHEVCVFYRCADYARSELDVRKRIENGIAIISLNNTFRLYRSFEDTYCNPEIDRAFSQILDETRPDVVHVQHLLYLSAGIIEQIKQRGIPVVYTLNDYWLMCPQGQLFKENCRVCDGDLQADCRSCIFYQLGIRKHVSAIYSFCRSRLPERVFLGIKDAYLMAAKKTFLSQEKTNPLLANRRAYMKNVCSLIDLFVAPSRHIAAVFVKYGIPQQKILYMPYGFNIAKVSSATKSNSEALRFGFIGNFMPSKGLQVLIESFKGISPDKANLKIYGMAYSYKSVLGGYVRRIKSMARQGNIEFMGPFDNSRIWDVFENIDVLVVPSLWQENSPLVIQEAFLAKTPVIASRIGGIPELITDGVNGFLFEAGNGVDLRRMITNIIEDPGLLQQARQGIQKVKSIDQNAAEFETLYAQLIGRSRK